jgi:hypothetical protein
MQVPTTKKLSEVFPIPTMSGNTYKSLVKNHTISPNLGSLTSNQIIFPISSVFTTNNLDRFIEPRSGYISGLKFSVEVAAGNEIYLESPYSIIKKLTIQSSSCNVEIDNYGESMTKAIQAYQSEDKFAKMFDDCGLSADIGKRKCEILRTARTNDGRTTYQFTIDFPDLYNYLTGALPKDSHMPMCLWKGNLDFVFTLAGNGDLKTIFSGSAADSLDDAIITYTNTQVGDLRCSYNFRSYFIADAQPTPSEIFEANKGQVYTLSVERCEKKGFSYIGNPLDITFPKSTTRILLSPYGYGRSVDPAAPQNLPNNLLHSCSVAPGLTRFICDLDGGARIRDIRETTNPYNQKLYKSYKDTIHTPQDFSSPLSLSPDRYNISAPFFVGSCTGLQVDRVGRTGSFTAILPKDFIHTNDLALGSVLAVANAAGGQAGQINGNKPISAITEYSDSHYLITFTSAVADAIDEEAETIITFTKPATYGATVETFRPRPFALHSQTHNYNAMQIVELNDIDTNLEYEHGAFPSDSPDKMTIGYSNTGGGDEYSARLWVSAYIYYIEKIAFNYDPASRETKFGTKN